MIQIGAAPAAIDSPIDHLVACHRRIEQRLDTLVRASGYFEAGRAQALAAIDRSLQFLDSSGALHTEDEEQSVFPRLRLRAGADAAAYLDSLEDQHHKAESILARLRELVAEAARRDPVPKPLIGDYRACAEELRSLYREHIRSEDEILTALAKRSLNDAEIAEITREMRDRRTESFAMPLRRSSR